jgi:hypothetical protein
LNRLEGAVAEKTLWFYRHFGKNLNRNKIVTTAAESCDYDDPNKIKFCPPAPMPPHLSKQRSSGKPASAKSKETITDAAKEEDFAGISPLLLTKCLDDPTDPDCVRLLQDDEAPADDASGSGSGGPPTPTRYVTSMPTGTSEGLATQEPTRDDCYGNMLDGRFCTSEMPSVSEEPTVVPEPVEEIPPGETAFTTADSSSMTFADGSEVGTCVIDVHNVDDSPDAEFGMPLSLVASTGKTVTFEIHQKWKKSPVEYIHTVFIVPPDGEKRECDRIESVPSGWPGKQ